MKRLLGICLLVAAGDLSAQSIPEPLVFDLVLALGAEKGQVEANSIFFVPYEGGASPGRPRLKELRPTLGLELELPFSGGRLTGFNLGAQYTLGDAFGGRFILKTLSFLRLFRQELAGQWIVPELALLTVGDVFDLLHAVLELGLDDWCVVHRFESAENFR